MNHTPAWRPRPGQFEFVVAVSARGFVAAEDFAGLLCATIMAHAGPPRDRDGMHLAVHEAIANAVQHGCLELGSTLRQTSADHCAFASAMMDRLSMPGYGDRQIIIATRWLDPFITVSIRDPGPGYQERPSTPSAGAEAKSGRGLSLIRKLADEVEIGLGGRCITMRFRK